MMQGLYTSASSLGAQQKSIDTIANNIANVNTTGFKSTRVDFKEALYTQMFNTATGDKLEKGVGVLLAATNHNFNQASIKLTEQPLDFAIDSDGFFAVRASNGEIRYTRDGSFAVSPEQDGNYLVDSMGNYVLDSEYGKIKIEDAKTLAVASDGTIQESSQKIGVFGFPNNDGLQAVGGNGFIETVASGKAESITNTNIKQSYLEQSNVDLAEEMVRLIKAQRTYQLSSRAITMIDQMEGVANNLRA